MKMLADYDTEAEDLVKVISIGASGSPIEPELAEVTKLLGQYDFDAAHERLSAAIAKLPETGQSGQPEQTEET